MKIKNISKNTYVLRGMKGATPVKPGNDVEVTDAVGKAHLTLYPRDFAISSAAVQKGSEPTAEDIKKAQAALANPTTPAKPASVDPRAQVAPAKP